MAADAEGLHLRTCPLCEAMCGLRIEVEGGRVARIRPDPEDVWSRGHVCPKGTMLGELHHDPDRLRAPLVRADDSRGAGFREATWDEAFAVAEEKLQVVLARHGKGALHAYIGNPTAHNFSLGRYVGAFVGMSGIAQVWSAGTVDQWPKNVVSALLYGDMWSIPVPDLDRTDFLLVLGANPAASQGSLLAAADVLGRLDGIRRRGGRVVVVDPRRTRTAERASEWLPIRPGTDAAFLMALVHVLFAERRVALGALSEFVDGVAQVEALARPFSPEAVAEVCQIAADRTRSLARELAAAPTAAVYGRIGTCNQEFGTLASWLVEVLNVLTGNLDRAGGSMFADPIAWSMTSLRPPDFAGGWTFGRFKTRVRGAPEILGHFPLSCLAEEIGTKGEGQIKGLVTVAGNPAISAPGADRLDAVLPELEAMVAVDNYLNETTRHADVILPGLSPLEQPHYDELIWRWAVRNAGNYSPAVFEPDSDRPHEWQILLKLAAISNGQKAGDVDVDQIDQLYFSGLVATVASDPESRIAGRDAAEIVAQTAGKGPERILDFSIRIGPHGEGYGEAPEGLTLERMRAQPHGIDKGALQSRLPQVLTTPGKRIDLAPRHITADLDRLEARLGRAESPLVLVSRRHIRSNNSWMHNLEGLMTGRDRCTLLVHPEDARRAGLEDGQTARVASDAGSLEVPVEVSDEMMPGVVCLPHGWGHDRPGTRLSVAARHAGVCNNVLAPGTFVDVPSGNAAVNGIPVEISRR